MSTTSFCNSNHILVGLGGTGGKILRAFKMRMFEEFHDDEERKKQPVALLYVDATRWKGKSRFPCNGQRCIFYKKRIPKHQSC